MTLARRKTLPHALPSHVEPNDAIFFLTICCEPRGKNHLCNPHSASALFDATAIYHERGKWWMYFLLLMPDHLHALVSFPGDDTMPKVVAA
jgi:putative transposase